MSMTSAEFKCLRESMGLSQQWAADHWKVSIISVKRWERNYQPPAGIEMDLRALKKRFDREVRIAAAADEDSGLLVPRLDVEAPRDLPAAWHRAIAQRAAEQSGARILYYDDEQDAE
ncbi:helix-turn-helix domain-containing protein [Bifidobacterium vansinderenii]|uniref:Uncharacterized protein n=1 Tax=Bifidobacterium vansinderenii TaxID=1984871 RepID=A0A229VY16_9BIFI|nr:hypothetical protein [Bifidobacterium vansinderenii]OXN00514.1 hypothetical protein Tam10B_1384 [Bifidobacterium vansinderenii]